MYGLYEIGCCAGDDDVVGESLSTKSLLEGRVQFLRDQAELARSRGDFTKAADLEEQATKLENTRFSDSPTVAKKTKPKGEVIPGTPTVRPHLPKTKARIAARTSTTSRAKLPDGSVAAMGLVGLLGLGGFLATKGKGG